MRSAASSNGEKRLNSGAMKRGAAHASVTLTASQTSQAHSHHHAPGAVHQGKRREHQGRADGESQHPLLEQVEREQTRRGPVEAEPCLDPKRAPRGERQAHELQQEEHAQDQQRALPWLGPMRAADERLHRRETAAERERELE